jgi:hypothetical protein
MSMHETHLCGARNSNEGDDEKHGFDMRHDCACFVCGPPSLGRLLANSRFLGHLFQVSSRRFTVWGKGHEVRAFFSSGAHVPEPTLLTVKRGEIDALVTDEAMPN